MNWNQNNEDAFPARHPREPGGLRQDILDEIADHLASAAEREAERAGENESEEAVRDRVLERFGDPDALARRLWWDQMRETVMREWIQTGATVIVAFAVVVFMALAVRQMAASNVAVLEALKASSGAGSGLVTIEVAVRRGTEDGPPAEGVEVGVFGAAFGGERQTIERNSNGAGMAIFGPMAPDTYEVYARDPLTGMRIGKLVETVFAGEGTKMVRIVAPDTPPREVALDFSPPFALGGERLLSLEFRSHWQYGDFVWEGSASALADGEAVWGREKEIADERRAPLLDEVPWHDLRAERYPFMLSGDVRMADLKLVAISPVGKADTVLQDTLTQSEITASGNGGYVLTLPVAIEKQLDVWRTQDHAAARGIELEGDLWRAVRNAYPDFLVDSAVLVDTTRTGYSVEGQLYSHGREVHLDYVDVKSLVEVVEVYSPSRGTAERGEVSWITVVSMPGPETLSRSTNARVFLALWTKEYKVSDFENDFQVWPVMNAVFASEWPLRFDGEPVATSEPGPLVTGSLTPELASEPAFSLSGDALRMAAQEYGWILLEVTETLAERDGGAAIQALMLRWEREELGFDGNASFVGADAAKIDNRLRRPFWLVLEPMAGTTPESGLQTANGPAA